MSIISLQENCHCQTRGLEEVLRTEMLTLEVPHGQELELPSSGPPTKQNSAQHLQMHPQHKQNLLITTPDVQIPCTATKPCDLLHVSDGSHETKKVSECGRKFGEEHSQEEKEILSAKKTREPANNV